MADQDQPAPTAVKDPATLGVFAGGEVHVEQHHPDGGSAPQIPIKPSTVVDGTPTFTSQDLDAALKELERRKPVSELVRAHLQEKRDAHPTVREHAELRGFAHVAEKNAQNGEISMQPAWQVRALLARFKAEGLDHESRISPEVFEKALQETLHGRV